MKLQQLRYIVEVANNNLNVSFTAEKLYTSQPGISKQIKLLEDELGIQIFQRSGKHLSGISPIGLQIIEIAKDILSKAHEIKSIASEHTKPNLGELSITTTYAQARYTLPNVIQKFMLDYPNVTLKMEQGSSNQCIANIKSNESDFAIISDLDELSEDMIALPCYHWNQSIIVKKSHPLANKLKITIDELAQYPLVSYDLSKEGADIHQAFLKVNLTPNIVFSTADADLIKTYVRLGVGVGIAAKMAIDENVDSDLITLNAGHIFAYRTTYIVFMRNLYLRNYSFDFIKQFSSHLNRDIIERALLTDNNNDVLTMFNGVKLPVK